MRGFPQSSVSKQPARSAQYPGSIPGSGRSSGKGNGNPLQYSRLAGYSHGIARVGHDLVTKPPLTLHCMIYHIGQFSGERTDYSTNGIKTIEHPHAKKVNLIEVLHLIPKLIQNGSHI